MKKHDYEKEILETLTDQGGCVDSFNVLMEKGHFNPKYLRKYLNKLKFEHRISINRVKNRDEICIENFDFDKEYEKFTADMEKIETKLLVSLDSKKKISLTSDYLFLALKKLHSLNLAWLHHECVISNKHQIEIIERTKARLFYNMKQKLKKLDENDRIRAMDTLTISKMMF